MERNEWITPKKEIGRVSLTKEEIIIIKIKIIRSKKKITISQTGIKKIGDFKKAIVEESKT